MKLPETSQLPGVFCCCMYELLLIRLFFYAADRASISTVAILIQIIAFRSLITFLEFFGIILRSIQFRRIYIFICIISRSRGPENGFHINTNRCHITNTSIIRASCASQWKIISLTFITHLIVSHCSIYRHYEEFLRLVLGTDTPSCRTWIKQCLLAVSVSPETFIRSIIAIDPSTPTAE